MPHAKYGPVLVLSLVFLVACESDDRVGPEPGCETIAGDVVLETQTDVNALAGVCGITGALEIRETAGSDDPITTLAPLSGLRSLGDDESSALRVRGTTSLTGLEGLEGVVLRERAELTFEGNAALGSLAALGADAEGAVTRLRDVRVGQNPALTDLTGLENVVVGVGADIMGELSIWDNASLASLAGLEAITGPIGFVYVASNPSLLAMDLPQVAMGSVYLVDLPHTSLDLRLRTVQNALLIESSHDLVSLSIEATQVGQLLRVWQNSAIQTFDLVLDRAPNALVVGLSHLLTTFDLTLNEGGLGSLAIIQAPQLQALGFEDVLVQDGLALYGTGLPSLDVFRTAPRLPDGFVLVNNAALSDVDAFASLESVGQLQIENNGALCVPAWVADVAVTGSAPRSVSGNLCD